MHGLIINEGDVIELISLKLGSHSGIKQKSRKLGKTIRREQWKKSLVFDIEVSSSSGPG